MLALALAAPALAAPTPVAAAEPTPQVVGQAAPTAQDDPTPFVAEVIADGVPIRAYPNGESEIRRHADAGDLLRVMGQAPSIDGSMWWATSEGFVQLETLQRAGGDANDQWRLPDPAEAAGGWWGTVNSTANVRTAPSADAPRVGTLPAGVRVKVLAEEQGSVAEGSAAWYRIDGGRFAGGRVHSSLIDRMDQPTPNATAPAPAPADGTWIVVDRKQHTLTLVQNGAPVFATYVSLGKAAQETDPGRYSTYRKLGVDDMSSLGNPEADHPYYLPNVPSVQYFKQDGSAIHGTYWHDKYGTDESQGCINLTLTDAAYLFAQTAPKPRAERNETASGPEEATPVLILE